MMKFIFTFFVPIAIWTSTTFAYSQDIIITKSNDVIKAKIMEIGIDEVKFKYYGAPDGPIVTMKKNEIKTMKLEGKTEQIIEIKEDPRSISNKAILDKTSCVKFYFFSPLNHHIAFGYEWMNKPGFNWEAGVGIIGPGTGIVDDLRNRKSKGAFLRFGPKFLLGSASDIEIEGAKYAHPLKGRYFKIEMILNSLSITHTLDTGYGGNMGKMIYTNKYQSMTFDIGYGRQFIFGNTITVGFYLGVGYSFENKTSTMVNRPNYWWDDYEPRRYSHTYFGKDFPLATTVRFTIGYIMRTPDWLKNKKSYSSRPPSRHSMGD